VCIGLTSSAKTLLHTVGSEPESNPHTTMSRRIKVPTTELTALTELSVMPNEEFNHLSED